MVHRARTLLGVRPTIQIDLPGPASLPEVSGRREARLRAGLSQQALAELLGVSRPTVTRWETGVVEPAGSARLLYGALLFQLAGEADTRSP